MACVYDNELFEKFRALAITEVDKLEIGKTYFTNSFPEKFVCLGFETKSQHDTRHSFDKKVYEDDKINWIVTGKDEWDTVSLSDRNVGTSYNPWLIFENEALANACRQIMKVEIVSDFDDHFERWEKEYLDD